MSKISRRKHESKRKKGKVLWEVSAHDPSALNGLGRGGVRGRWGSVVATVALERSVAVVSRGVAVAAGNFVRVTEQAA